MERNRPRGRDKNVVGGTGSVNKRGGGLGTGPVGSGGRNTNGQTSSGRVASGGGISGQNIGGGAPTRAGGGKSKLLYMAIVVIFLLCGGGGYSLFGGGDSTSGDGIAGNSYTGTVNNTNTTKADTTVASGSRDKYTEIIGNNKDTVTIMVYMCGTDLESKNGMATADLNEMAAATLSDNINLIVYTGGCKSWKNRVVSSDYNQIYQVKDGGLVCLEKNMGTASMTNPDTLTGFINYCTKNYPANRNELIFWDHGGGSLSGYGYDEKNASSGSMNLAGINKALENAGIKFDFIGFDACLMATMENALMLTKYADYLIASEETEPGVGWYYTNWLTDFAKNTSMSTVEVGKKIVDDFVDVCATKCSGQKTTLSVVDLAELENTIPDRLAAFARSTNEFIKNDEYKIVSNARYNTREFAKSSQIDQIDLVDLAKNLDTKEGAELVKVIEGAVKYNRTSSNMSNAYGISIYFPYQKTSKVNQAISTYSEIGMDSEYAECIREFANLQTGGQTSAGGSASSMGSLMGSLLGSALNSSSGSSGGSIELITQMLGSVLSERSLEYLSDNYFDASGLVWSEKNGKKVLKLPEEQWDLVQGLDLNVFYDDGEGFIDLGLDNVYEFNEDGDLIGEYDNTWLSINGQVVPYYHLDTVEEGDEYTITGYVPVMLNDDRAELILVFDNAKPYGYIAGARNVYKNGETETVAKSLTEVKAGDRLDFICDYYSYDGNYEDSYYLGDTMILDENVEIGNIDIGGGKVQAAYRFTDIYNQPYWTSVF